MVSVSGDTNRASSDRTPIRGLALLSWIRLLATVNGGLRTVNWEQ